MKTKSALSWFGSDSEVAAQLASHLDHCKHVTIPFCGGLSILPHLKARAIVANDLHSDAVNFYRAVSGVYGDGIRHAVVKRCERTLSHPSELEMSRLTLTCDNVEAPIIERAWSMWAQCWLGIKGKGGTSKPATTPSVRWTAAGGTNASRLRAAANDLLAWAKEFERCEFTSMDYQHVLDKVKDQPDCGIYCDPPWVDAGDAYLHTFSEQDHYNLHDHLKVFAETRVLLRYGDHPFIRDLYYDWNIIEETSRTQANSTIGEVWITNA